MKIKNLWSDLLSSIKIPSITTIGIMIIYPFLEIFLFKFIGEPLSCKLSLYTIILTLTPFVLGYKISNKIFTNGEVVVLLLLSSFIILSGITLKSNEFSFDFSLMWYLLALSGCICWIIIDFSNFTRIRSLRKEYSKKKKNHKIVNEENNLDGMEVE